MILNGKVATPKEEWDYKMALNRARFEEQQYQNRATHYQGREVASPAPDGGPRRQSNKPKDDSSNKAKRVVSQIFDLHGITETEINTDPNGIVTEVKKKTPATVFDDDNPFYSEARESARSSIATPPSFGEPPAEAFGDGPNDLSPHIGKDGRYLTNAEFYGEPADHWESAPINKTVVLNEETGELEVQSEDDPVVNDTGLLGPSDSDMWFAQDRARQAQDQRDLLELKDRHPDLFVQMMNEGGFESRPDPHPHAGEGFIENEEGEIVPVNNIIDDGKWALDKGLFTESSEYVPPPGPHSILEEEANNLTEDITEEIEDPVIEAVVEDAIKTIATENPEGIETLNAFATWANSVSDEEAIKEAETYLQELKDSPTVDERFRKAMAIGMIAMLFGDDFATAMNTGFGVVADDYAEEKAEAEAEALAEAKQLEAQNLAAVALAKQIAKEERDLRTQIAKEERDLGRTLSKEERDYYKTLEAEQRALTKAIAAEQRGNATWADRLIITENIAHQKLLAQLDRAASAETLAEAKAITADNFAFIKDRGNNKWSTLSSKAMEKFNNVNNFQSQMDGALDWMVRNWSGQVDFGNNADQRVAFEKAFDQWMIDKQRFNPADFATYIQDAFIKDKFTSEATYIEPSLIMPDLARDPTQRTHANETVAKLYKKVETQIIPGVGSEKHALMLLKKDFNHYRDYEFDGTRVKEGEVSSRYAKLLKHANKLGEGVFTRFVNQLPASSIWGFVYDPDAKGKSATQLGVMSAEYLASN